MRQSRPRQNGYDETDIADDVKEKNPCVLLLGKLSTEKQVSQVVRVISWVETKKEVTWK